MKRPFRAYRFVACTISFRRCRTVSTNICRQFIEAHLSEPRTRLRVIRVEADAGSGKTFLATVAANHQRDLDHVVVETAFTAKAASNYTGGTTSHYAFRLSVSRIDGDPPVVRLVSPRGASTSKSEDLRASMRLQRASLVIIDEITMMRAAELDAIVDKLGDIEFTGVVLILGNNAQLGPVLPHSTAAAFIRHHVTASRTYADPYCLHVQLRTNVRMQTDPDYHEACRRIGYALDPPLEDVTPSGARRVRLPTATFNAVAATDASVEALRRWAHPTMYDDHPHYAFDGSTGANVIICPTRALELEHNLAYLARLPGKEHVYQARDDIVPKAGKHASFEAEVLTSDTGAALDESGQPYYSIPLKPGAPVQLLRTVDAVAGLRKGVNAVVHACGQHSVTIRLLDGTLHRIPRITFEWDPKSLHNTVTIHRHQLPLALNWASTIHRVQGDTLGNVLLDLRHSCFCHGQFYTTVSRVRTAARLRILVPPSALSADGSTFVTMNVVQTAVFQHDVFTLV